MLRYWKGMENVVFEVARWMRDEGRSPDEVIAAYREHLRGKGDSPAAAPPGPQGKRRGHRAGDFARLPNACPKCGGEVELLQLCHIGSPVWRTQLACMADGCAWHGKSRLPIDALLARGAEKFKINVTEG